MVHFEDYPVSFGQMILSSSLGQAISNTGYIRRAIRYYDTLNRKRAETVNDDFLDWMSSRDKTRPFFAFLNYYDAHEPLLPPIPFDGRFGPTHPSGDFEYETIDIEFQKKHDWSESDSMQYRNAYDSSIAYIDNQLGVLFSSLAEQGVLDNTVVIITSDHGELLGEHGLYGHSTSLYIEALRVPLLIRFPARAPQGVRVQQTISLRDIPPTVLDLVRGTKSEDPFPGKSLGRYFDNTEVEPESDMKPLMFWS